MRQNSPQEIFRVGVGGGGGITGGFLRSSGGFPGGAFHILSPESDLKARRVRFSGL